MKLADPEIPVRSTWLTDQGFRLDPRPYLSGAYQARKLLERLPCTEPLRSLTRPQDGIFHPGRVIRQWVTDPDYGVPFFSSTDILEADFSYLPLVSKKSAKENPQLLIQPYWTLITRSGTVGRTAYSRPDAAGFACSEHVMRVVANPDRIRSGYLHAFLASRYGAPLIESAAYGAIVQHIEPHHIENLEIPRLGEDVESRIHGLIQEAAQLRVSFQAGVVAATEDLFTSAGLPELLDLQWQKQPRDLGFRAPRVDATTLRALNFSPRAQRIINALRSVPHCTLGEICEREGGTLRTGARFKRIDADPECGVRLIGQRQAFWVRPLGRWINATHAPKDIRQSNETVLIAAHGTLGENEVYGRSIFVTGRWLAHAFSQDFVRVRSGDENFSGAYLFALLRSESAFRMLRSMSVGGKQQEYHTKLLRELPVPLCMPADRERIAERVRRAYRDRDLADGKENEALRLLDEAVQEAAR